MTTSKLLLSAALAGVMAAGVAASANADEAAAPANVKCYGIAKAGQNACGNSTGTHACKGEAKVDNDPSEFVEASAADCEKAGGKTTAPEPAK